MANYDFENLLSPLDFEYLMNDIISKDLNISLTSFGEGVDAGIDLRYSKDQTSSIVVQCKRNRYITKNVLESEKCKIKKINPTHYYLALSCNITPAKMDQIKSIFQEWMAGDENIYTRNRINDLLDKYPDIHRKNYKLWLNSSTILGSIVNHRLYDRSKALVQDIKKSYRYYVKNPSFNGAIDILNKHRFVIISGIPGIGKTTLAKLLLWEYLQQGFEVVEIRKISEGEELLIEESDAKQVFYFDDFLGENFLKYDVVEGRSNDLLQFVNRIMSNKNKILIMTTREYILQQAKDKYEKLNSPEFNISKYTLDLNSYTKKIRALILYNHLYYSDIDIKYIKNILNTKSYKKIINHKNYNPRIIEQMTVKLADVAPEDYSKYFLDSLNNPFGIWERAFKSQISEGSKYILYVLLSIGQPILLPEFRKAMDYFFETSVKVFQIDFNPLHFEDYLKELEGSFIKIDMSDKRVAYVEFQNPSIKDFLLGIVQNDKKILLLLLNSAWYFSQLIYTINYLAKRYIADIDITNIITSIIKTRYQSFEEVSRLINNWVIPSFKFSDTEKLDKLNNYLLLGHNKELERYLLEIYEKIEFGKLYGTQKERYVNFYMRFKNFISIKIDFFLERVFKHITNFGDVKVFLSLKNIAEQDFTNFIANNEEAVHKSILSAIKKDIENRDDIHALNELLNDLDQEIYDMELIPSIEYESITSEIHDKIQHCVDNVKPEVPESKLSKSFDRTTCDFDEDTLFRLDLFTK